MEVISFFAYPLAACILLILIHAYFGIHILERGIIFVDLSLAQFIGVGIACSFLFDHDGEASYLLPAVFAVLGAFLLSWARNLAKHTNIEAFIGVLYIFSLAASILVLDRSPHGMEEFKDILNGNIIWVSGKEVLSTLILYGAVGIFHYPFRVRFFRLSREGHGHFIWEFLFFLSFAVVLVKSVQMAGILQVFAFLIIPALIGRLFTRDPAKVLVCGWLLGFGASAFGLFASYRWDLPTAPLIVAALGILYFCLLAVRMKMGRYTV
ncbi:MAG: metal ABC transporter permease [Syntrophales bacterium]|nr:metal ABC transporter permease [Syntrophales bacterium]